MKTKDNSIFRTLDSLCLMWLIGISIYVFMSYGKLPDTIPMHYNLMGEIDRYADKSEIFILLVIAIGMHSLIGVIEGLPSLWNTGIKITETNKELVYGTLTKMIKTLKYLVSMMFGYMILMIIQGLPNIFYIFIIVTICDLGYWLYRLCQINKKYN